MLQPMLQIGLHHLKGWIKRISFQTKFEFSMQCKNISG